MKFTKTLYFLAKQKIFFILKKFKNRVNYYIYLGAGLIPGSFLIHLPDGDYCLLWQPGLLVPLEVFR